MTEIAENQGCNSREGGLARQQQSSSQHFLQGLPVLTFDILRRTAYHIRQET